MVVSPFSAVGFSGRDDPGAISPLSMNHRNDDPAICKHQFPEAYVTLFAVVEAIIGNGEHLPFEDRLGFLKADQVFLDVALVLGLVPFKVHSESIYDLCIRCQVPIVPWSSSNLKREIDVKDFSGRRPLFFTVAWRTINPPAVALC